MQFRLWHHVVERRAGRSLRGTITAVRIFGELDVGLLRACIEYVVHRHESLRTRFRLENGALIQVIGDPTRYPLETIDLSGVPASLVEAELDRQAQIFVAQAIDLSTDPLFEALLFMLTRTEYVLVVTMDHMVTDAASEIQVNREIWNLYFEGAQGMPFSLPELPLQFGDYAVWQARNCASWLKRHEAYWRRHLLGAPHIRIPFDERLVQAEYPLAGIEEIPFGLELSAGMRELARQQGAQLATVVLAIYCVVMARWCGQNDLVVVFVSSGRHRRELQNVVGFLATLLHLRITLTATGSFVDLLRKVTNELYSAYHHHDFDRVPLLIPECTTELYFNWIPADCEQQSVRPVSGEPSRIDLKSYPLVPRPLEYISILPARMMPFFSEGSAGIKMSVAYRTDLVTPQSMVRLGEDMRTFAERFVADPAVRLLP